MCQYLSSIKMYITYIVDGGLLLLISTNKFIIIIVIIFMKC